MNSKMLAKELKNYQTNIINGGLFDSEGIGEVMQKEAIKSDVPLIHFLGSLKGLSCFEIYSYWEFRDKIQEYQKINNISSIYFKEVNWDNFIFRYAEKQDQLLEMPQDRKILKRYKDKVVSFFIEFSKIKFLKNYNLYTEEEKDGYSEYISQTIKDIKNFANKFKYASIYPSNSITTPVYESQSNFSKVSYWTKSFSLFLYEGDLDNPCESKTFELYKQWDYEPPIYEI